MLSDEVPVERADGKVVLGDFSREVRHLERVTALGLQHFPHAVGNQVERLCGSSLLGDLERIDGRQVASNLELACLSLHRSLGSLCSHGSP